MPVFQVGPPTPARGGQPGFIDPMEAIKDQEKVERFQNLQSIVTSFAKKDAQERKQHEARIENVAEANLKREYRNLERFGDDSKYSDYVESGKWMPEGLSEESAGFLKKSYLDMKNSGLSFFEAEKNRQAQTAILNNTEKLVTKTVDKELQEISQIESIMSPEQLSGYLQGPDSEIRKIITEELEKAPVQLADLTESQMQAVIDKAYVDFKEAKVSKQRAQKDRAVEAKFANWTNENKEILDFRDGDSIDAFQEMALEGNMSLKPKFATEILGEGYSKEQFEALERVAQQEYISAQKRNTEQMQASVSSEKDARVLDLYMRSQGEFESLRFVPVGSSEFNPKYDEFISTAQGRIKELEEVSKEDSPRAAQARRSIRSLQDLIKVAEKSRASKVLAYKESDARKGIMRLAEMNLQEALRARIATGDIPKTPQDVDKMVAEEIVKLGKIELASGKSFDFSGDFTAEGFPPGKGFEAGDAEKLRGDAGDFASKETLRVVKDIRSREVLQTANETAKAFSKNPEVFLDAVSSESGDLAGLFENEFKSRSGESWSETDLLTKEARGEIIKRFKTQTKRFIADQLESQNITFDELEATLSRVHEGLGLLHEGATRIRFTEAEKNRIKEKILTPGKPDEILDTLQKEQYQTGEGNTKQLQSLLSRVQNLQRDNLTPTDGSYRDGLEGLEKNIKKDLKLLQKFEFDPLASFDSDKQGRMATSFRSDHFLEYNSLHFVNTPGNDSQRAMIMDRLLNTSGKQGYTDYVTRYIRRAHAHGEQGDQDSHKIARNFVSQFLSTTTNNKVKNELSSLYPSDLKSMTEDRRKDGMRSLALRLAMVLPESSNLRKEIDAESDAQFGGKSMASLEDLVFRGLVESAGLEGFLSKQFYVKANVHKLNISDEDISFMLADASANGSGKDTVLIDLFRRVVGGRPPILSGSNASLSAYLEGWKQNQEALKEQVRADMDAGLPWYQKIGGKDPVLVEITDQEFTSDRQLLENYTVHFDDGSIEQINLINQYYNGDERVKGQPVAPPGTGIEFQSSSQPTPTTEPQAGELDETEEAKPTKSQSLNIPELPAFDEGTQMKSEEEIAQLMNVIYGDESPKNSFSNVNPDVFLAFHPDAFPGGEAVDLASEGISGFFGGVDMSMVNFVSSNRDKTDYYSDSIFQTFGGNGRGETTNVSSPSGEYEKEDLRVNPMFEDIWESQMKTVEGINAAVEDASDATISGAVTGGFSGAMVGGKMGAAQGLFVGGPLGSVLGAVVYGGIGGLFGSIGGGAGLSFLGADEEEQKAYIEAYNPESATPVEIRFMIHSLARIQEVREKGNPGQYGHTFSDLNRLEQKLISDLAQISPSVETFLGDLD